MCFYIMLINVSKLVNKVELIPSLVLSQLDFCYFV